MQERCCLGSGCGNVGRAVASNSRVPRFESNHRQKSMLNILLSTVLKSTTALSCFVVYFWKTVSDVHPSIALLVLSCVKPLTATSSRNKCTDVPSLVLLQTLGMISTPLTCSAHHNRFASHSPFV